MREHPETREVPSVPSLRAAPGPGRNLNRCAAVIALAAVLAVLACSGGGPRDQAEEAPTSGDNLLLPEAETREVLLLFAAKDDDSLQAERRELPWNPSIEERAKAAVNALIAGPQDGLLPVLPKDAVLRELFVTRDGTAVVDFAGGTAGEGARRASGSSAEIAAIYSIVDTLALNFTEIRRVGFLVDGEETETLFGHLDTRYPIAPGTAPLQAALATRLRAILAERGEAPVEAPEEPAPAPSPGTTPAPEPSPQPGAEPPPSDPAPAAPAAGVTTAR